MEKSMRKYMKVGIILHMAYNGLATGEGPILECLKKIVIDDYFEGACSKSIRIKIYAYIAICGFLWSNWCEYKSICGVEFGEYSLRQYRYAKDYYRIVKEELSEEGECIDA